MISAPYFFRCGFHLPAYEDPAACFVCVAEEVADSKLREYSAGDEDQWLRRIYLINQFTLSPWRRQRGENELLMIAAPTDSTTFKRFFTHRISVISELSFGWHPSNGFVTAGIFACHPS